MRTTQLHAAVGKVGAAEILAAISASIDAIGGASEDEIWIARVQEDGKRFDLAQRVFPVGAIGGAAKHSGETTLLAGVITADAGEYIRWDHSTVLRGKIFADTPSTMMRRDDKSGDGKARSYSGSCHGGRTR